MLSWRPFCYIFVVRFKISQNCFKTGFVGYNLWAISFPYFSQRTINVWNKLSTDCVQASSVNMFKNKIDKYLVKAGYT